MEDMHTNYLRLGLSCGLCKGGCLACRWGGLEMGQGAQRQQGVSAADLAVSQCTSWPAGTHLMQRRRLLPPQMHWSRLSSWPQQRPAVRNPIVSLLCPSRVISTITSMNAGTASQAACPADTVVHHMLQIIAAPPVQTRGSCRQMRLPGLRLQAEVF